MKKSMIAAAGAVLATGFLVLSTPAAHAVPVCLGPPSLAPNCAPMKSTQQMQGTQMSFNLQYLGLQDSMQQENRDYSCTSNILKTRQGTKRNTISNIH